MSDNDRAYILGYCARKDGIPSGANPFGDPRESPRAANWWNGWNGYDTKTETHTREETAPTTASAREKTALGRLFGGTQY